MPIVPCCAPKSHPKTAAGREKVCRGRINRLWREWGHGERIVHLDGYVEVEAAFYGAPLGWIGRVLRVQWDELHARLLYPKTGQLLREHVRQKRGWYHIKEEDHPERTPLRR